jgi:hypothetical protein
LIITILRDEDIQIPVIAEKGCPKASRQHNSLLHPAWVYRIRDKGEFIIVKRMMAKMFQVIVNLHKRRPIIAADDANILAGPCYRFGFEWP